ncbi:NAD(P)/FAD-dependent oxidoreductase [Pseudoxanthobacter sp.]|uniref:NAD(P)/FAD-dependent oxidoreductase n=1 Tax=Pseudoxanthobacter sp. TaxID=1925742 RepID=UPI002FE27EF9
MNATLLTCDVAVVGAGPAGLAAAAAARESGADVVCLDLFAAPGGQYHMQPAVAGSPFATAPQVSAGRAAAQRCRDLGVRLVSGAEIFWAEPGFTLFARQGGDALAVRAGAVVAATGAMERPVPFAGWTLPGVIGAGAAQRLIKANGTAPGRNVVLAGSGPFLFAVAETFAKAGLNLRAFIEMRRPGPALASPFLRHPARIPEALRLLVRLGRVARTRLTGHVVTAALGEGRVEAVRVAPLDADGSPRHDRAFVIDGVDCLCVGYGFRPVTDLTSLLHATHAFDDARGGWHCAVAADTQATDVPGLFAAGETTGIGGAIPARLSGRLAGFHAAAATGRPLPGGATLASLRRELARARDFAAGLAALYPFPGTLAAGMPATETVCRCEDVTRADIEAAVRDGAADLFSVKMWTRAGMGPCQGRICGSALGDLLAASTGQTPDKTGFNRPHMPLRPVPLAIADAALALADTPFPSSPVADPS